MADETSTQTTEATTEAQESVVTDNGQDTETVVSYANGKYNSISELEKGYIELQSSYSKKLGGFTGAPEDGYVLGEGVQGNEVLAEWGKENQLSNDGYSALVEAMAADQVAKDEAFRDEQMKALGENADYRLKNIVDFTKANFGEESIDTLGAILKDAKSVELIEKMIKGQGTKDTPAEVKAAPIDADKIKAMRFEKDEFGNRRMSSDPSFRAKVEAMEAQLYAK